MFRGKTKQIKNNEENTVIYICAWTGRKDSNNKKIYEYDVFTVGGKNPKIAKFVSEENTFCIANIEEIIEDGKHIFGNILPETSGKNLRKN